MPDPIPIPDPDDSWAQVELFRWQHGRLPSEETDKQNIVLSVPAAMRAMAIALQKGHPDAMPAVHNTASVLKYAAKLIEAK